MVLLRFAEKTTGMSEDSSEKKELTSSFGVDGGDSNADEMPGVTKLLNRKSFAKSASSRKEKVPPAPTEVPPPAAEVPQVVLEPAPTTIELSAAPINEDGATVVIAPPVAAPQGTTGTVQKLKRRRTTESKPLLEWTHDALLAGSDPLGKALAALLDSGISQSLFLGIQAAPGSPTPVFVASAAVNAGAKGGVWTGLRWDPAILPEIWNQLVTVGFVELPPPGTMTNLHSARNVSRAAFDVGNEECLVLARVGTAQMCRGILVLISRKSLIAAVKQVMPMLSAAPTAAKKSA